MRNTRIIPPPPGRNGCKSVVNFFLNHCKKIMFLFKSGHICFSYIRANIVFIPKMTKTIQHMGLKLKSISLFKYL